MSEVLTEKDEDELEIVEVETLPEPGKEPPKKEEEPPPGDDDEDDDEHEDDDPPEDARLADQDEDPEENAERKKRLNRRAKQKAAKARTESELVALRAEVARLSQGQQRLEGANLATGEAQVEFRLVEVRKDIATAETLLADAVKNSDGDTYAAALRLRDEAKAQETDLARAQETFKQAKERPQAQTAVADLANRWSSANPWYKRDGSDNPSAIVNAIDAGMISEGHDPATPGYWSELTRRVQARLVTTEPRRETTPNGEQPARRKAPPLGNGREQTPPGQRREVYVTPARKAAMQQAGVWDDPKERAEYLREYAKYDREQSANR